MRQGAVEPIAPTRPLSRGLGYDTFEHARAVRTLDMRASPYDLRDWGFDPVAVETAAGKAEYVRQQREFAATGARLRERLLAAIIG